MDGVWAKFSSADQKNTSGKNLSSFMSRFGERGLETFPGGEEGKGHLSADIGVYISDNKVLVMS